MLNLDRRHCFEVHNLVLAYFIFHCQLWLWL